MVVDLVIKDLEQISALEWMLMCSNITYSYRTAESYNGIKPPHLVVDGVPLDTDRSFKWIEGRING